MTRKPNLDLSKAKNAAEREAILREYARIAQADTNRAAAGHHPDRY